jgi:hypothetical protein
MAVVSDILARVMDSDSKRAEFESQDVTDYNVAANSLERGPVVEVTGQGPNPAAAIRSTEVVLTEVDAVLSELQRAEGADPDYFIKGALLEPPSTATAMYGSTVRAAIAVLAIGAVGMFGLAVLAEAFARRRAVGRAVAALQVVPDAASPGTERATSDGPGRDWSGIMSAFRLGLGTPSGQEPSGGEPSGQERSGQERLGQESGHERSGQEPAQHEPSKPAPAWQKTFQQWPSGDELARQVSAREGSTRQRRQKTVKQEASTEPPANNGHVRPTTDRSP